MAMPSRAGRSSRRAPGARRGRARSRRRAGDHSWRSATLPRCSRKPSTTPSSAPARRSAQIDGRRLEARVRAARLPRPRRQRSFPTARFVICCGRRADDAARRRLVVLNEPETSSASRSPARARPTDLACRAKHPGLGRFTREPAGRHAARGRGLQRSQLDKEASASTAVWGRRVLDELDWSWPER